MQRDEDLDHRAREPLVHGEAFAPPIAGGPKALELANNGVTGFLLPFPYALDEGIAAHGSPVRFLSLLQLALDHHLGGDAGVVGAWLPQHVTPAHALET